MKLFLQVVRQIVHPRLDSITNTQRKIQISTDGETRPACPPWTLVRRCDEAVIGEGTRETRQKQEWTVNEKSFKSRQFLL